MPREGDAANEIGQQLAAWGKVARIQTRGRATGRPAVAAVGFVEEADGGLLVAAGSPDADWARNLEANPSAVVTIEGRSVDMTAEALSGDVANRAVVELILKYGTPAERLGRGPVFRLVPASRPPAGR
ncbi:MAG: nitroreductase family deazaflavin-dependent oxidoreductase [Chloroflexi bacterium]|nr:nitroreductase family deazaflavin-dependent oxidoreductase [Chloroflexota bacterium]